MERKEEILLTMQRTIKNGVHYLCLLDVSYIDKSILRHINYVAMQKTHISENRRDLHFNFFRDNLSHMSDNVLMLSQQKAI